MARLARPQRVDGSLLCEILDVNTQVGECNSMVCGNKKIHSHGLATHYLQDSIATDHGVIAKECTNGGEGAVKRFG